MVVWNISCLCRQYVPVNIYWYIVWFHDRDIGSHQSPSDGRKYTCAGSSAVIGEVGEGSIYYNLSPLSFTILGL